MTLNDKEGLYKTVHNKTDYYFYIIENTGYELIGHAIAIDKRDITFRLNRELTMGELRDKSSVWMNMEKSNEYNKIIKGLFEKNIDIMR